MSMEMEMELDSLPVDGQQQEDGQDIKLFQYLGLMSSERKESEQLLGSGNKEIMGPIVKSRDCPAASPSISSLPAATSSHSKSKMGKAKPGDQLKGKWARGRSVARRSGRKRRMVSPSAPLEGKRQKRNSGVFVEKQGKHEASRRKRSCYIRTATAGTLPRNQCPKCPFISTNNLTKHMNQHGKNYQHQCEHCDYSSKLLHHVVNHMEWHNPATPKIKLRNAKRLVPHTTPSSTRHGILGKTPPTAVVQKSYDTPPTRSALSRGSLSLQPETHSSATQDPIRAGLRLTKFKIRNLVANTKVDMEPSDSSVAKVQEVKNRSLICAILLGLGYDCVIEPHAFICGLNVDDAFSTEDAGLVELTLITREIPNLEEKYGSELILQRCKNKQEDSLTIFSADNPAIRQQLSTTAEILDLLGNFGFTETTMRLMLLNQDNVDYLMEKDDGSWFEIFSELVRLLNAPLEKKLRELNYSLQRPKIIQRISNKNLDLLKELCNLDAGGFAEIKEQDIEMAEFLTKEIASVKDQIESLENKIARIKKEISEQTRTSISRVRKAFDDFLAKTDSPGYIIISTLHREIAISLRPFTEDNMAEASNQWRQMSAAADQRRLSVTAFFVGLWEISTQLVYFADVYSDSSFSLPKAGNIAIYDFLQRKCAEGRQGFVTLPQD